MEKVDVIINVYGKPWQTLCTLKSLKRFCNTHIDKIYMIEEKEQPYGDSIDFIKNEIDNLIHYIPSAYEFFLPTRGDMSDVDIRYRYRYQYGIETSDKRHVFITHNDMLYNDDIIGNMLETIGEHAGIGLIGQCWNCPASMAAKCNGEGYLDYKPNYLEVMELVETHKPARGLYHNKFINIENPMPLPECRLNEFACIINRDILINESYPNGDSPLFGAHDSLDTGTSWFRSVSEKGYFFKNYDINKDSVHGYFANAAGYPTQLDKNRYIESEANAKKYFYSKY